MSTRGLALSSPGGSIVLGREAGISARIKTQGFGWPKVTPQWSEGAAGRRWRGSRVAERKLSIPFTIRGTDRADVLSKLSLLARTIDPANGLTRFTVEIDGARWWVDMTMTGGGGYSFDSDTTDGSTILLTEISFETEESYWTRTDQASAQFTPGNVGVGLLGEVGSMVGMTLSSVTSLGEVTMNNPGDAAAPILVKVEGPFSGFAAIGAAGETVTWTGVKDAGEFVLVNMGAGTAVDEAGENVYSGLNDVPEFWQLKPGESTVDLQVNDAEEGTLVTVYFYPRRWVLF